MKKIKDKKLESFIFPDFWEIKAESLEKAQEKYFKSIKK